MGKCRSFTFRSFAVIVADPGFCKWDMGIVIIPTSLLCYSSSLALKRFFLLSGIQEFIGRFHLQMQTHSITSIEGQCDHGPATKCFGSTECIAQP